MAKIRFFEVEVKFECQYESDLFTTITITVIKNIENYKLNQELR